MKKISRPISAMVLTGVIVAATAGGAYAYWLTTGTGTGTATVGQIKVLEIRQSPITEIMLDTPTAFSVSVKNPNDFVVSLKGLTKFTVTGDVDKDHRACKFADNFKVKAPVLDASTKVIGARESVSFKDGSITLTNDPNLNQIACQGATVTLSYELK
jgi:hypothetical protein